MQRVRELPGVDGFAAVAGLGVQGVVDGHAVLVGRPHTLADWSLTLPPELGMAWAAAQAHGRTVVAVAWDGASRGILTVADAVKPTSAQAIRELRGLGLSPILLTGDNATVARSVAGEVGIDDGPDTVISGVMPANKVEVIKRL